MDHVISTQLYDSTAATVFTNDSGQVVFVDQSFLKMMHLSKVDTVAGEPLHKVLGLDQKMVKALLEELFKARIVRNKPLDIRDASGSQMKVSYTGIASYDPKGSFIGADVILRPYSETVEGIPDEKVETPVAQAIAPTSEPVAESAIESPTVDNSFLEFYFTSQIKGQYILLSRSMGVWVHNSLDKLINETAQKNGWAVHIHGGLFTTDLKGVDAAVYHALLLKVIHYAVSLIGQKLVLREIERVDGGLHEGVLALADQAGLRNLLKT
jgi:hypothetical protein